MEKVVVISASYNRVRSALRLVDPHPVVTPADSIDEEVAKPAMLSSAPLIDPESGKE